MRGVSVVRVLRLWQVVQSVWSQRGWSGLWIPAAVRICLGMMWSTTLPLLWQWVQVGWVRRCRARVVRQWGVV